MDQYKEYIMKRSRSNGKVVLDSINNNMVMQGYTKNMNIKYYNN